MTNKKLSIHIDKELLDKLHYVSNYEGRSANSEILMLIRDAIKQHEEKYGEILYKADKK